MGTTPSGLWYPDSGTPLTPLATVLSTMQSSVETALAQVRTDLAASWPQISIAATGATRQVIPNNTVTDLTGNSGGWQASVNTGGTFMSVTTGVTTNPIHILKPGKYLAVLEVHIDIQPDLRAFINLLISGTLTGIRRMPFTHDDTVANSVIVDVSAVPTSFGVQVFSNRTDTFAPNLNAVTLDVYKMP